MKKIALFLSILFFVQLVQGQEHRFSAGVGTLTTNQFDDFFSAVARNIAGGIFNGSSIENGSDLGEFRFSYAFTPGRRLAWGATISYNLSKYDIIKNSAKQGAQTSAYYTFAGEGTYYYLQKDWIRLYGLLGAGITMVGSKQKDLGGAVIDSETQSFFNFQVTPVGLSVGRRLGGFAELGFGYRGVASIGAYYRL